MISKIFVNLPVKDLDKSMAFFKEADRRCQQDAEVLTALAVEGKEKCTKWWTGRLSPVRRSRLRLHV